MTDSLFEYTLSDGIHHITALDNSGKAIQAILEHVGNLFVDIPMTEKTRILIDFRHVPPPPMSEWLTPVITFFRRQGPETGHPARVAYIYSRGARGSILNFFLSVQRFLPQPVTLRFFSDGEFTQARSWLHAA